MAATLFWTNGKNRSGRRVEISRNLDHVLIKSHQNMVSLLIIGHKKGSDRFFPIPTRLISRFFIHSFNESPPRPHLNLNNGHGPCIGSFFSVK